LEEGNSAKDPFPIKFILIDQNPLFVQFPYNW